MALDKETKDQLGQYLELLESEVVFQASLGTDDNSVKVKDFLEEITAMSNRLSLEFIDLERKPSFKIAKKGQASGVIFAGLPLGHEFTSFILALLQVSGRAPKVDEAIINQIKAIKEPHSFETYVSLTCHNCPDVVQALNIMAVLNPLITHTMVEGGMFQDEIEAKKIMAVPTVFSSDVEFASGRLTIEQLVEKITGPASADEFNDKGIFDVLVVGGGPAGNSAAIYAARKGIKTGMVVETYGGQVMDTVGIENMIGTPYTEGPKLMAQIEGHAKEYPIDIMKNQRAKTIRKNELIEVELENGAILKTKTAILAVGASWRNVNVPGEEAFRTKGVTNCPHCDGPLFTGKDVAVIGGGNSGIEAALDLAGLAKHVYVLEFLPELKADQVLQDRANEHANITILKNVATKEITGTNEVDGISYIDRATNEEHHLALEGVFVQIGLVPNSNWLKETEVALNERGEITVDAHQMTNIPGIFAAGDCTDSAYKQIIISMGAGASAALGAFDYLIRQ
ncbi:alkyl hydroperoxide reductase subunit F [Enterococcus lemanii]|uniref:Alkyl hydroperoxide reductase subunit F n=1 Tax=Enterococcus lemanii TaxID=1159752 RepID=A0ABV9MXL2_9ENTE|nr:alkyl hydroperoxide reductase subunit F [Enterococcus lemanii]MBM7709618.1 alkyl hydroperoxide reductase subunit F [Enterococcus lemanii]NLM65824.1 alkyl hydroperoxide reductase subunit F [Enterococcus sp.]